MQVTGRVNNFVVGHFGRNVEAYHRISITAALIERERPHSNIGFDPRYFRGWHAPCRIKQPPVGVAEPRQRFSVHGIFEAGLPSSCEACLIEQRRNIYGCQLRERFLLWQQCSRERRSARERQKRRAVVRVA